MDKQISILLKRYAAAIVVTLLGLLMLIYGLSTHQDSLFIVAAIFLLLGGVIFFLYCGQKVGKTMMIVLSAFCGIGTIYMLSMSWTSITNTVQHQKEFDLSIKLNQFRLTQVRTIQRAYKKENGYYAPTFKELERFFKQDSITKVISEGTVPSRRLTIPERDALYHDNRALDKNMTEREAALLVALGNPGQAADLAHFKRDTVKVLYKKEFLGSNARNKQRQKLGFGKFNIDSLQYVPMTNASRTWNLETRKNVPYLKDTIPTIHVYGKSALSRYEGGEKKVVGFGNLSTNSDEATWE